MPRKRAVSRKKRKAKQQNKAQYGGGFVFQNYIVCLIDILGQSEQLKSWPPLPAEGEDMAPFESAVMESLGVIELLTIGFRKCFELFLDEKVPISIKTPPGVDPAQVAEYRRLAVKVRENKIGVQQFSDTLVFYAPLFPRSLSIPSLMPIVALVQTCSNILLDCLSRGIAFRGGISIGVGTYTKDYGFYGPVLQESHHIESKVAQYPRIVFGKHLLASLHQHARSTLSEEEMRFYLSEETVLQGWIFEDYDGCQCIDFIGKGLQESVSHLGSDFRKKAIEKIRLAYDFVCSEENRFRETNPKLFERYKRLREYMDSRLGYWEMKPASGENGQGQHPNTP